MSNPVGHFEIGVSDYRKAVEFYTDIFAWDIQELDPSYSMIHTGQNPGGGIHVVVDGEDTDITFYVTVDDIESKLKEAVSLGASIVAQKTKISDEYGWFGKFRDPEGNLIGLWSKD